MDRLQLLVACVAGEFDERSPILAIGANSAIGSSAAPAKKSRKQGAETIANHLEEDRDTAEPCCGYPPTGLGQLGIDILRKGLADAAHEVADHAGAADLRQRPGQHVADRDLDARRLAARD